MRTTGTIVEEQLEKKNNVEHAILGAVATVFRDCRLLYVLQVLAEAFNYHRFWDGP